jgi:type VI protein secretion system component VasA
MRLYINGVQVSQNTSVTQSYVNEIERIGAHFFNGNPVSFWNGKIAEVRVYSEALAAEDVLANYDNSKARFEL